MARYVYGGSGAAQVVSGSGAPTTATATVKNARTAGATVTDVLNISGGALAGVVTPDAATGQILFQGPDGYTDPLWLDFGSGPRWAVHPVDLNALVTAKRAALAAAEKATPSGTTAKASLPYTANTIGADQMAAIDPLIIPRVADATARSAAFPSPTDGDRAYMLDSHAMASYSSGLGRWAPQMTLLGEINLAVNTQNSVQFTGIPQNFKHLLLVYTGRCASAGTAAFECLRMQFNGDTAANYRWNNLMPLRWKIVTSTQTFMPSESDGSTAGVTTTTDTDAYNMRAAFFGSNGDVAGNVGYIPGTLCAANARGGGSILIPNYSSSSYIKTFRAESGWTLPAVIGTTTYGCKLSPAGSWNNVAAITSILLYAQVSGLYDIGTTFSLYGLA